ASRRWSASAAPRRGPATRGARRPARRPGGRGRRRWRPGRSSGSAEQAVHLEHAIGDLRRIDPVAAGLQRLAHFGHARGVDRGGDGQLALQGLQAGGFAGQAQAVAGAGGFHRLRPVGAGGGSTADLDRAAHGLRREAAFDLLAHGNESLGGVRAGYRHASAGTLELEHGFRAGVQGVTSTSPPGTTRPCRIRREERFPPLTRSSTAASPRARPATRTSTPPRRETRATWSPRRTIRGAARSPAPSTVPAAMARRATWPTAWAGSDSGVPARREASRWAVDRASAARVSPADTPRASTTTCWLRRWRTGT